MFDELNHLSEMRSRAGDVLVWRGRPLTQKAREKGSGNQPIPEWYHSPGILGNSTLSVLLMECGLFTPLFTPCSINAAIANVLSSLMPTAAFQWNKTKIG